VPNDPYGDQLDPNDPSFGGGAGVTPFGPATDDQRIWPGYDPQATSGPDNKQALYDSVFGNTGGSPAPSAPSSGSKGGGPLLHTNDPNSAAYRGPAQGGLARSVSPWQTGNLRSDFSSALRTLINGPSPSAAGRDVLNSAPVTAFNANAKRNEGRDRQFLAERAAAGGYSGSGGFETGVLGLRAKTNEAMDRFAGEQAGVQEQGRRQELMQALAMALQFGDSESARELQRELGLGSLDVQRHGINTGRENNLDSLGFNYANLQNNMNNSSFDYFR
jgi:hypothetical protein